MFNKDFRLFILTIVVSFMTLGLFMRLYYIQIIKGKDYTKFSVEQKIKSFNIMQRRGEIYDKNMIPFTDRESDNYVFVVPEMISDKKSSVVSILNELTGLSEEKILKDLNSNNAVIKYKCINRHTKNLPLGLYEFSIPIRYGGNSLARHVIGYYGGINSGLEQTFDKILKSGGNESIAVFRNNGSSYLKGLGAKIRNTKDNVYSIKTTLDYKIQKTVEEVLDKNKINGSVVVLNIKTGDILAMASRPNYDQNKVGDYLKSKNEELINKAVMQYPPGSIFKIIVASAALESGKVNFYDNFIDDPSIDINGVIFHNFMNESNGIVNIDKAFSVSSNTTFIKIGQKVGGENIINLAKKFGLTIDDNLPIEEKVGTLPSIKNTYGAGIGNLSIGQGNVTMTPLQAADIAATIANNGVRHVPNLIYGIVDENGDIEKNLHKNNSYRVISSDTASIIKKMMRDVVLNGTGENAETEFGSAGKTGSAEVSKELNIYHAWFTGFTPYNKPKYAISVFVQNGDIGGIKAAPIFKEISEEILKYYK